jgi:rhodanese-related sulfurtransferase
MPRSTDREGVQRLRSEGAQVVEVLPKAEYEWAHIVGAISLPLKQLNAESAAVLDRSRVVVTYCNDFQ